MSKQIVIGYWKNKNDTWNDSYDGQILSLPVENSATINQSDIIQRLKHKMENGFMVGYRGFSHCRLCGIKNGTRELEIIIDNTKYSIPEGYLHYLEHHNVAVDPLLFEILGV